MPTMMNVNEAKANFSSMLAEVESQLESFTILKSTMKVELCS